MHTKRAGTPGLFDSQQKGTSGPSRYHRADMIPHELPIVVLGHKFKQKCVAPAGGRGHCDRPADRRQCHWRHTCEVAGVHSKSGLMLDNAFYSQVSSSECT